MRIHSVHRDEIPIFFQFKRRLVLGLLQVLVGENNSDNFPKVDAKWVEHSPMRRVHPSDVAL